MSVQRGPNVYPMICFSTKCNCLANAFPYQQLEVMSISFLAGYPCHNQLLKSIFAKESCKKVGYLNRNASRIWANMNVHLIFNQKPQMFESGVIKFAPTSRSVLITYLLCNMFFLSYM